MPHPSHPTILQTADSISGLESSKWIYHERALAEKLGLSLGQLRGFVQSVGKGGGNIPPPYNEGVDLDSGGDDNILNLHRMKHGSRSTNNSDDGPDEDKPSLSHVMNGESFYYQVGRKDTLDSLPLIRLPLPLLGIQCNSSNASNSLWTNATFTFEPHFS